MEHKNSKKVTTTTFAKEVSTYKRSNNGNMIEIETTHKKIHKSATKTKIKHETENEMEVEKEKEMEVEQEKEMEAEKENEVEVGRGEGTRQASHAASNVNSKEMLEKKILDVQMERHALECTVDRKKRSLDALLAKLENLEYEHAPWKRGTGQEWYMKMKSLEDRINVLRIRIQLLQNEIKDGEGDLTKTLEEETNLLEELMQMGHNDLAEELRDTGNTGPLVISNSYRRVRHSIGGHYQNPMSGASGRSRLRTLPEEATLSPPTHA